jgi:hypothetical protein
MLLDWLVMHSELPIHPELPNHETPRGMDNEQLEVRVTVRSTRPVQSPHLANPRQIRRCARGLPLRLRAKPETRRSLGLRRCDPTRSGNLTEPQLLPPLRAQSERLSLAV